ncbi:hypothetical protein BOW13_11190 [Solemya velum gill symbiont]|uniref:hypothetical protein n=1 Tax=Solemya velum gill symbiont TaxID=2340 RepID=UPI000996219F|nr:hypothetical protein [Solemya velum gill symbiont]OOY83724.1 hypothetical protein BOW13_11190 [Solemya velum gill symbiont]
MIITGGAIAQPSPSSTTDYDPTASLSLTIPFGAGGIRDFGISLNLLTTNEENAWMGGAGVTFYPARDNKLGCSVIGGRNFTNSELHFGYDFCQKVFNFGVDTGILSPPEIMAFMLFITAGLV